jgi:hypothetical protein
MEVGGVLADAGMVALAVRLGRLCFWVNPLGRVTIPVTGTVLYLATRNLSLLSNAKESARAA